jgi:hypothetical protein
MALPYGMHSNSEAAAAISEAAAAIPEVAAAIPEVALLPVRDLTLGEREGAMLVSLRSENY